MPVFSGHDICYPFGLFQLFIELFICVIVFLSQVSHLLCVDLGLIL